MDISEFVRRLHNAQFECQQSMEIAAKKQRSHNDTSPGNAPIDLTIRIDTFEIKVASLIKKTPLREALDKILMLDQWDEFQCKENQWLLPLTHIHEKSPREAAGIICRDVGDLIDFLNKATWEQAPLTVVENDGFRFVIEQTIEQLCKESTTTHERSKLSKSGKTGGVKPKKREPVQQAINKFLQKRPRYWDDANEYIAEEFCRLNQEGKAPEIKIEIGEDVYQVYSDRTHENIFFKVVSSPTPKKRESDAKSITTSTFIQHYIPEAKKKLQPSK